MDLTATLDITQMSMMERISLLPRDEQIEALSGLTESELMEAELWLRPKQLAVLHDKSAIIVYAAGRGAGKTFVGAKWVIEKAKKPGTRIHLVGRTVPDVRDVMVQGESGIINSSPPDFVPEYMPSVRRLLWPNGSMATTFSAEVPDMLRGPQADYTWADEVGTFKTKVDSSGATAWDNILISTRLGANPQILVTTTPRRTKVVRQLFADAKSSERSVSLHGGSTLDNKAHLSPEYLTNLIAMYEGTALAEQELHGVLVDEILGALWRESDIVYEELPEALLPSLCTLIGVDPGLTTGGDTTGIVTVRGTMQRLVSDRRIWVVRDDTEPGGSGISPERWAARVVAVWQEELLRTGRTPVVVAEKNAGGELVSTVIHQCEGGEKIPVALVSAKGSKAQRAEPILLAYRRDRVRHIEELPDLVDEMTSWEPEVSGWSPGRIDALVHAARALIVDDTVLAGFGTLTAVAPVAYVPQSSYRAERAMGGTLGHRDPHNARERAR
jgi:phage terminase large subunit-like protein